MRGDDGRTIQIDLVTETYVPEINGVANTLSQLVTGMERRGHRVHLIRPRQKGEQAAAGSDGGRSEILVRGLPIPGYPGLRFGLPAYWRLRQLWRKSPPDVVYIATQGPLGHAALAAARGARIPVLSGFHTRFHDYSGHYGIGILAHVITAALRRFHNRSNATLVPTEKLRNELTEMGFENVHALGRGVDTALFNPNRRREDLRRSWGCESSGPVVLYVGRLAAEKNLGLLIESFRDIRARSGDAKLVLVGDGPELEPLRRAHPDVVFTGAKLGVELAEHYASGDLFLFPSLTETFGNVVPEAMASGLPVIAFDYGAAGIHVRAEHNGVKVPKGDAAAFREAAVAATGDGPALRAMGANARRTAEGMSWDRVVCDLEARLVEVIDRYRTDHRHETLAATTK